MTDVIRYHRFSTIAQEGGDSLERQDRLTSELCTANGWTIIETLQDLGRSAWKGHHLSKGHLGTLTRRIEAGLIAPGTIIVAEKFDRLARLPRRDTQRWIQKVTEAGLKIALCDPRRVYDNDTSLLDEIEILLRAELAWQESQQKSDRVLSARKAALAKAERREGAWVLSSQCPRWLIVKPGRDGFDVDEHRVGVVRQMYELSADGVGAPSIARILNEQGEETWGPWSKNGKGWDRGTVRQILDHPAVEGIYQTGASMKTVGRPDSVKLPTMIVDYFPRIIDADLAARARSGVSSRKLVGKRGKSLEIANLFAGKIRCSACGGPMVIGWGPRNKSKSLRCSSAKRSSGCANRTGFKYGPFEKAALEIALPLALDSTFFEASDEIARLRIELATLKQKAEQTRASQRRFWALIDDAESEPDAAAKARNRELSREIRDSESEIERVEIAIGKASGVADDLDHIRRVNDIREAMTSPIAAVRQQARGRVQSALREIVQSVFCNPADEYGGDGRKTLTLILRANVRAYKFDNDGGLIGEVVGSVEGAAFEAGKRIEPLLSRLDHTNQRSL